MFGWFKRKRAGLDVHADDGIPASMFDEVDQEHEDELVRISEYLEERLEAFEVDVGRRKFVAGDGTALGIDELARRIHGGKPDMAVATIEECVIDWLEQSYIPDRVSEAQMEKLQGKVDDWVNDYQHGAADEPY